MLRRCISFLVIVGLFASQLAAVPHAHAGMSAAGQQKHDSTPHFHNSWLGHNHHGKAHSHGDHKHQHAPASEPAQKSSNEPLPVGFHEGLSHDATAVYCPPVATSSTSEQPASKLSVSHVLADGATFEPLSDLIQGRDALRHNRPPDKVLDGSNIYLTLRNLRI